MNCANVFRQPCCQCVKRQKITAQLWRVAQELPALSLCSVREGGREREKERREQERRERAKLAGTNFHVPLPLDFSLLFLAVGVASGKTHSIIFNKVVCR